MVTISGSNSFPINPSRCLLASHGAGLCHLIRMQGSLGKQVFLAGQIAAFPKSQGPIDKSKSEGRYCVGNSLCAL